MARPKISTTEPLLPVIIAQGGIRFAPGIKAGRWVFATGHKGTHDYVSGMAPQVLQSGLPHYDKPKHKREAEQIFFNLERVLQAGGAKFRDIVRLDQYYTTHRAVEPYHDVRRAKLGDHIPPSTSVLQKGLLLDRQEIEVQIIAVRPGPGFGIEHVRPKEIEVHPTSGYSPALKAGNYVFVAGRLADSKKFGQGIPPGARLPQGYIWKGVPIKLETEFILRHKIEPALRAAGSSLSNVLKFQVYLRDLEDFAPFNEIWASYFGKQPPATTLIPMPNPGLVMPEARIEINTIALTDGAGSEKEVIDAGVMPAFKGYPQAVRSGDLLFLSGMLAIDGDGLVKPARIDSAQPYFGSSIQEQMKYLLDNAEKVCRKAGTSLSNIVRIQQFHMDLKEFYQAYQVWERHLPAQHLPFSAVEVPFLPHPNCSVMLDLWVYVPC